VRFWALFALVLAGAFATGHALAEPAPATIATKLQKRHEKLMEDLARIEKAAEDWSEIQAMRATGKYVLNRWEKKMEKDGKMDFHIFLERYRNDTLETLQFLERALGKEAYVDPLRKVFGDHLDTRLDIDWEQVDLMSVAGWLQKEFDAKVGVEGVPELGLTISFRGNMTLLAAILQIENLFDVRMRVEGDKLWFVVPTRD